MSEDKPHPGPPTEAAEAHPEDQARAEASPNSAPKEANKTAEVPQNPGAGTEAAKPRRSGRISKKLPIVLYGQDAEGRAFTEETHTVVVSSHGAGVVSQHRFVPEQELVLQWPEAGREAKVRVVGEIGAQGGLHTYGLKFVEHDMDLWQMEFPPAPQYGNQPAVLLLECLGCDQTLEVPKGGFEYDICVIHGGLTKYCWKCGCLSVWTKTTEEEMLMRWLEEPGEAPKTTERRGRLRVPVNFFACVRSVAFGEDLVSCVDMSRGGVAFQSSNRYRRESMVEIAVPFAAEVRAAASIFVTARITNVTQLPDKTFRCGVEFLWEKKTAADTKKPKE